MPFNIQDVNNLTLANNPKPTLPDDLIGAKINWIGFPKDSQIEGGGLVIDYLTDPLIGKHRQITLGFTELGMWVEDGPTTISERS